MGGSSPALCLIVSYSLKTLSILGEYGHMTSLKRPRTLESLKDGAWVWDTGPIAWTMLDHSKDAEWEKVPVFFLSFSRWMKVITKGQ